MDQLARTSPREAHTDELAVLSTSHAAATAIVAAAAAVKGSHFDCHGWQALARASRAGQFAGLQHVLRLRRISDCGQWGQGRKEGGQP